MAQAVWQGTAGAGNLCAMLQAGCPAQAHVSRVLSFSV